MGKFIHVSMMDPEDRHEEEFDFDKFMLDQEKTWDGPYTWEDEG